MPKGWANAFSLHSPWIEYLLLHQKHQSSSILLKWQTLTFVLVNHYNKRQKWTLLNSCEFQKQAAVSNRASWLTSMTLVRLTVSDRYHLILSRSTSADQTAMSNLFQGQTLSCSSSLLWLIIPFPIISSCFSRWSCNTFRLSLGQDVPLLVHWQAKFLLSSTAFIYAFDTSWHFASYWNCTLKGYSSSSLILLVGKSNQSLFLICSHQLFDGCFLLFKRTQHMSRLNFNILGKNNL